MSYPRSGPCGRLLGPPASCARASPGPLLARLGVLPWEAVFPSPAVHRRLAAPCVPPVFLSLLVTWPAWCVLSRLKLFLLLVLQGFGYGPFAAGARGPGLGNFKFAII